MTEINVDGNLYSLIKKNIDEKGSIDETALKKIKDKVLEDNKIDYSEKKLLESLADKSEIVLKSGNAVTNISLDKMNFSDFTAEDLFASFTEKHISDFSRSASKDDCQMLETFLKTKNNEDKETLIKDLFAHPNLENFNKYQPNYATQKILFQTLVNSQDEHISAIAMKSLGIFTRPPIAEKIAFDRSNIASEFRGIKTYPKSQDQAIRNINHQLEELKYFYGGNVGLVSGNDQKQKEESKLFRKIVADKLVKDSEEFSVDFMRKNPEIFGPKELEELFSAMITNNDKDSVKQLTNVLKEVLIKIDGTENGEKNGYALGNYMGALGKAVEKLPEKIDLKAILVETINLIPFLGEILADEIDLAGKISEKLAGKVNSTVESGSEKIKEYLLNNTKEKAFLEFSKMEVSELMAELHKHLRKVDATASEGKHFSCEVENSFLDGISIYQTTSFK